MITDDKLDQLLRDAARPEPGAHLTGMVLAGFAADQQAVSWRNLARILWPFGPVWQPISALVLVAVMGAGVGAQTQTQLVADGYTQQEFGSIVLGDLTDYAATYEGIDQ